MDVLRRIYKPQENHDDPPGTWTGLYLEGAPQYCEVVKVDTTVYLLGQSKKSQEKSLFWSGNLDTNNFSKIDSQNCPAPRKAFIMTTGIDSYTIVLAGGIMNEKLCRDFWVYSIRKRLWQILVSPDSSASDIFAFYGQSLCSHNSVYLLFGGCDGQNQYSNSLFLFDPLTKRTEQLHPTGNPPAPRYMHRSLIIVGQMYVFGGGNHTPIGQHIDVYCLDLNSLQWKAVQSNGNVPCSRAAHSCQYDDVSQQAFVFGGFSHKLSRMNDLYSFDVKYSTWKSIDIKGSRVPTPRSFHSSVVEGNCLYIFGGNNAEDKQTALEVYKFQIRVQPLRLAVLASNLLLGMESSFL